MTAKHEDHSKSEHDKKPETIDKSGQHQAGITEHKSATVTQQGEPTVSDIQSPEHVEASKAAYETRLTKLNEHNQEGHDKNMQKIEDAHNPETQKSKGAASREGEASPNGPAGTGTPDPKLGREDNSNTPVVSKEGAKSWLPPGVAFSLSEGPSTPIPPTEAS